MSAMGGLPTFANLIANDKDAPISGRWQGRDRTTGVDQIGYSCDVATPAAPDLVLGGLEEKYAVFTS